VFKAGQDDAMATYIGGQAWPELDTALNQVDFPAALRESRSRSIQCS
jgi:hypothetical protein